MGDDRLYLQKNVILPPMTSNKITLYGHSTCPQVGPIKGLLKLSNVEFDYKDIHKDSEAAETVRTINDGYESVPTLVFPDGSTLTEPSTGALKAKLAQFGHKVGIVAWLIGNAWLILMALLIAFSIARLFGLV